jgi:hypothetical protein
VSTGKSLLRSAAADESWANTLDRTARTANGRKAFNDQFEKKAAELAAEHGITPSPEELAKKAEWLRRAYLKRLAAKSVAVHRSRSLKSRVPNPSVSQQDRDAIDDVGLPDVDDRTDDDEALPSYEEPVAT